MRLFRAPHPAPGSLLLPGGACVVTVGRAGRPLAHAANDNRRSTRRSRRRLAGWRIPAPAAYPFLAKDGRASTLVARWGWPIVVLGAVGALVAIGYRP